MNFDIENVTEPGMAWDEYSVMLGMKVYTVIVENGINYSVYDSIGKGTKWIDAYEIIEEVKKYRKGESNEKTN